MWVNHTPCSYYQRLPNPSRLWPRLGTARKNSYLSRHHTRLTIRVRASEGTSCVKPADYEIRSTAVLQHHDDKFVDVVLSLFGFGWYISLSDTVPEKWRRRSPGYLKEPGLVWWGYILAMSLSTGIELTNYAEMEGMHEGALHLLLEQVTIHGKTNSILPFRGCTPRIWSSFGSR